MSQRMIDVGPGCFCQSVRWLECLMFSLLVALLCIFLCQRHWAIWTARALQRPAGHPSSSWRRECSASAECRWFVMTREPADRQVSYKKTCTHFPFVVRWKHRSCNRGGGGQLLQEAGTWQLCHLTNLQTRWLEVFCLLLCLRVDFGSGVAGYHRSPSVVERHGGQSCGVITILSPFSYSSLVRCVRDVMALGIMGRMLITAKPVMRGKVRGETLKTRGRESKSQFFSQAPLQDWLFSADLILDCAKTVHVS